MYISYRKNGLPLDVFQYICTIGGLSVKDLRSFAAASHRLREAAISELFRYVVVKGDWNQAIERLQDMRNKLSFAKYYKSFRFMHIRKVDWSTNPPTAEFCSILHSILGSATSLTYLSIDVPEQHVRSFQDALGSHDLYLPTVKTLVIAPFCDNLVPICPNMNTLDIVYQQWTPTRGEDFTRFMRAVQGVTGLETFQLRGKLFNEDIVYLLSQFIPNVKTLSLCGPGVQFAIHRLAPLFTSFKSMHTLVLPSAAYLQVGYNPPRCGTGWLGKPREQEVRQRLQREHEEAISKIINMLLAHCPWVKTVWVGRNIKIAVKDGVVMERYQEKWQLNGGV